MSEDSIDTSDINNDPEYGAAWKAGEDAYKKGLENNPHPKCTLKDSSWNDAKKYLGWNDGFHHAQYLVADIFDPHGARKYPYIAHVEDLLGGMGRVIYPDGDYQFGEYDKNGTLVVYSPKLSEPELEQFCKENFERYEQHYNEHQEIIDNFEQAPPIEFFWCLNNG